MVDQDVRQEEGQAGRMQGRDVRMEFLQSMWFPLIGMLVGSHFGLDKSIAMFTWFIMIYTPSYLILYNFCHVERLLKFRKWTDFGLLIGCIPTLIGKFPGMALHKEWISKDNYIMISDWFTDAASVTAWQDLLMSAALAYIIPLYFAMKQRGVTTDKHLWETVGSFYSLMAGTVFTVQYLATSGTIEFESMTVACKSAVIVSCLIGFMSLYILPNYSANESIFLFYLAIFMGYPMCLSAMWKFWNGDSSPLTIIGCLDHIKMLMLSFFFMGQFFEVVYCKLVRAQQ